MSDEDDKTILFRLGLNQAPRLIGEEDSAYPVPTIEGLAEARPPAAAEAPAPAAGDDGPKGRLGRYQVREQLGAGGMGEVLLATDTDLGRQLAIKVLRHEIAHDKGQIAKFVREAQVTGQLEHPGIVPVHELGATPSGAPFFTMKRIRGMTLADKVRRLHRRRGDSDKPLSPEALGELLLCFIKVCEALAFAHDKGVVHRDLKPDNVMVGAFGEVLVVDWGLAKLKNVPDDAAEGLTLAPPREGDPLATLDGTIVGTPAYMPPEQAEGRIDDLDQRTDIYGLGAILYELLTGRRPYDGKNPYKVLERVLKGPPPKPSKRGHVPWELEAVVLKAMARNPRKRYQKVGDLQADIEAYLAGHALGAVDYNPGQLVLKWAGRHKKLVIGAIAVVMLAMVLSTWSYATILGEREAAIRAKGEAVAEKVKLTRQKAQLVRTSGELERRARELRDKTLESEANLLASFALRSHDDGLDHSARILAAKIGELGAPSTVSQRALQLSIGPPEVAFEGSLELHAVFRGPHVACSGRHFAFATNTTIQLVDGVTGSARKLDVPLRSGRLLALSEDGQLLALQLNRRLALYDARSNRTITTQMPTTPTVASFVPGKRELIVTDGAQLYRVKAGGAASRCDVRMIPSYGRITVVGARQLGDRTVIAIGTSLGIVLAFYDANPVAVLTGADRILDVLVGEQTIAVRTGQEVQLRLRQPGRRMSFRRAMTPPLQFPTKIAFDAKGRLIVASGATLQIWTATSQLEDRWRMTSGVRCPARIMTLGCSGDQLLTAHAESWARLSLRRYRFGKASAAQQLPDAVSACWDGDEHLLISKPNGDIARCRVDGSGRLSEVRVLGAGLLDDRSRLLATGDGRWLAAVSGQDGANTLRVWRREGSRLHQVHAVEGVNATSDVLFLGNDRLAYQQDNRLIVRAMASGSETFEQAVGQVVRIASDGRGDRWAFFSVGSTELRLMRRANQAEHVITKVEAERVRSMIIDREGQSLIVTRLTGAPRILDLETGAQRGSLFGNQISTSGAAARGIAAIATFTDEVTLSDLAENRILTSIHLGGSSAARQVAFSPDGRRLLVVKRPTQGPGSVYLFGCHLRPTRQTTRLTGMLPVGGSVRFLGEEQHARLRAELPDAFE